MELGGIYRIDFLEELVRIYSMSVIDEKSLYAPIEGRKEFKPDLMLRRDKLQRMVEKMQRVMNPDKIDCYVKAHMGESGQIQASQLPLENTEDFVKIIYVRLYGQRRSMSYTVEAGEEIDLSGYRFRDFTIRRKSEKRAQSVTMNI